MPKREKTQEKRLKASKTPSGTNIPVSVEVKEWLVTLKHSPYEPYDMVIRRIISVLKGLMSVDDLQELRRKLLEYEPSNGGVA